MKLLYLLAMLLLDKEYVLYDVYALLSLAVSKSLLATCILLDCLYVLYDVYVFKVISGVYKYLKSCK